jgi:hypothetical protein
MAAMVEAQRGRSWATRRLQRSPTRAARRAICSRALRRDSHLVCHKGALSSSQLCATQLIVLTRWSRISAVVLWQPDE